MGKVTSTLPSYSACLTNGKRVSAYSPWGLLCYQSVLYIIENSGYLTWSIRAQFCETRCSCERCDIYLQGPDAASESFSRLPSLAKTASLQSLPAQEQQPDGSPAAGRLTGHSASPARAEDHHPAQPATTSNGDAQEGDLSQETNTPGG